MIYASRWRRGRKYGSEEKISRDGDGEEKQKDGVSWRADTVPSFDPLPSSPQKRVTGMVSILPVITASIHGSSERIHNLCQQHSYRGA